MKLPDIKKAWNNLLSEPARKSYRVLDIFESIGLQNLCIAVNPQRNRCLLLESSLGENKPIKQTKGQNICFERTEHFVKIELVNSDFENIFDDLILSLAKQLSAVSNEDSHIDVLTAAYANWTQFFDSMPSSRLNASEVQGLFGELWQLNQTLDKQANSANVDTLLKSWRGPYKKGHDFIFEAEDIEVKTVIKNAKVVQIGTEVQLELDQNKHLELLILTVEKTDEGMTLKQLSASIINQSRFLGADTSIYHKALKEAKVVDQTLDEYDDHQFVPAHAAYYDCGMEGFPKLTSKNLNPAISKVSYSILIDELEDFKIRYLELKDDN